MNSNENLAESPVSVGEKAQLAPELSQEEVIAVDEMINAGVLHGRKHSKLNPKMSKYTLRARRGIDVFDLLQTKTLLEKAIIFFKDLVAKDLPVLVVCTKPAAKDLAKDFADKFDFPYVTERWLGGTLTNFGTISKRVDLFKKIRSDKETGELKKYTKKERLMLDRKLEKMERLFSGIEKLTRLPAALFIIDIADHNIAVREAVILKIPIIGLINTDGDPELVQYPIPCNDNARPSISWVLGKIEEGLREVEKEPKEEEK